MSNKLELEKGDVDFYRKLYKVCSDLWNEDKTADTITIDLGEINTFDGVIDSSLTDTTAEQNYERLIKLKKYGAIKNITHKIEEKTVNYEEPEEGISMHESFDSAIATCTVERNKLTDVFKELEFSPLYSINILTTREILINDIYILSRPDLISANDIFVDYINARQFRRIAFTDILIEIGKAGKVPKKTIYQYLADLNFTGEIQKLFMPEVSKNFIVFRPIVMRNDFNKLLIDTVKLEKQLSELKRVDTK